MKKILTGIASVVLLACTTLAFADVKIGVLDVNQVLMSAPQTAAAKADLKKKFDPRGQELANAQKQFQAAVEDFNKNSPTMKDEDKKATQQKLMEQNKKLQDMQASLQNDATTAQNQAMQGILKTVEGVVQKIAADKQLDLVISKISTAYNSPKLEITDDVVKAMKDKK